MKIEMKKGMLEAKKFLSKNNVPPNLVDAPTLVKVSSQLQKSFDQTLDLIAFLKTSGSGYGPFPYMNKITQGKYQ